MRKMVGNMEFGVFQARELIETEVKRVDGLAGMVKYLIHEGYNLQDVQKKLENYKKICDKAYDRYYDRYVWYSCLDENAPYTNEEIDEVMDGRGAKILVAIIHNKLVTDSKKIITLIRTVETPC